MSTSIRKFVNEKTPKNATYVVPNTIVSDAWDYNRSNIGTYEIPYGFDIVNTEKVNNVLVVGDYNEQDFQLIDIAMDSHPSAYGIGYNSNTKEYSNFSELLEHIDKAKICITLTSKNKPPLLAMLAASRGCCVITNSTAWSKEVFGDKSVLSALACSHLESIFPAINTNSSRK